LGQLLNSDDGFSVCGEASSAPEAMTLIRKLKPDMVIVDLGLKGPGGLELTKSIRFEFNEIACAILSMHDEAHLCCALIARRRERLCDEAGRAWQRPHRGCAK